MKSLRALLLAALAATTAAAMPARAQQLTVSAAASLTHALREVAPAFEAAHPGTKLQFNFGASGALLQQIARGAPVDVFASADHDTMDQAQARALLRPGSRRDIVSNALVVVVPAARSVRVAALADLTQPSFARIAIGLPASVPVGRYTQGVLQAAGLWSAIQPKMIGANNVRQALDYAARGEVDAAFVYATDAALVPDKVRIALTVPTAAPIRYPAAVLAGASNAAAAQRFVEFLLTPAAQRVFARHGFAPPP
jgi:molybdate transport system substrate-binding protein